MQTPIGWAAQIPALRLLPALASGLQAYLQTHPDALTSGKATGPSALRRLLDVLAADHPTVQRMRCHRCGAQARFPYRKDGASICCNCYRRMHWKVCVRAAARVASSRVVYSRGLMVRSGVS